MKIIAFSLMLITVLALTACAPSVDVSVTEPSFSDQVATVVAGTLQAAPPTKTALPAGATPQPQVITQTPAPSQTSVSVSCPNALTTRLQVGGYAYVSLDPPLSNRVRKTPGPDGQIIGDIEPGEAMKILSGPTCAQDRLWWEVQALEGDLTGWTAEGDSKDYWLVPCSAQTNCGNP